MITHASTASAQRKDALISVYDCLARHRRLAVRPAHNALVTQGGTQRSE